jgi:type III restriction enzyme
MKLKFKQQSYQTEATDAIASIFAGQQKGHRKETVGRVGLFVDEVFSNKRIELSEEALLTNIQTVQKEQGLPVSSKLESPLAVKDGANTRIAPNLTIEMETGTGKTYVYTKAMFELNQRYGWNKFIIMVPSVAIREGVYKSLSITAEHFQETYGKKLRYFIYDTKNKSNLTNINNFASTANIEVIVMNYQAFGTKSQDGRKIFQKLDELQSQKPIDVIRRARPILIIDEPQRFGPTAEGTLKEFDPLFITRYSATHKEDFNKIYRLDAIDAYNQKLVKKIKVKGIEVRGIAGGSGYLFLDQIHVSAKTYPSATVQMELEARQGGGVKKVLKRISEGDNLYELSEQMRQYEGYVVREINANTGKVTFTNGVEIYVGQVLGDVDEKHLRTIQIREAIKSHIEKERELFKRGIKVLTLFFIDEVAKYRAYDEQGNQVRSEYEEIFEEEYKNAIQQPDLFEKEYYKYLEKHPVKQVHNGYFSVDKKGRAIDSKEKRGEEGSDDVSAYDLIMKDKERLLSFDEPTRFIFSHSALREGWDNPNIFQICTLRHTQSTISKRQEIGRGLRIAVNSDGERMDTGVLEGAFFDVNTLTVVANESYDSFARDLQREVLESLKGRPSRLETVVFEGIALKNENGGTKELTDREIRHLLSHFEQQGYLDEQDHVTQKFVDDRDDDKLQLPEDLKPYAGHIIEIVSKVHSTHEYKAVENERAENVDERDLQPNDNFAKREFQDLWSKIKVQTVYEVEFKTPELIEKCVNAINANLSVRHVTAEVTTGEQTTELDKETLQDGTSIKKTARQIIKTETILGSTRYDLLDEVVKGASVTRQTVATILKGISKLKFELFKENPEDFINGVVRIINEQKAATLIDNIRYLKTDKTYEDDVFTINRLQGSLEEDVLAVKKHIYDYIKTDSKVERKFAQDLELGDNKVVVYAKLPRGFKIPTPVGNYSPDWAIVFDEKEVKHIYFIAETKVA